MPIGETLPSIAEIKGNTILELVKNAYNKIRDALGFKQNKLVAGDNIIIDETTNRISAIQGGTPVLDDYYTKTEVNEFIADIDEEVDAKADSADVYEKTDVYTKTEVDNLISDIPSADAYTKSETDALLSEKSDKSDTYTKTQVDNLISGVEVDAYTKSETDILLNGKADKSDTYTKTEVVNLINTSEGNCNIHKITLGTVTYDSAVDRAYIPALDEIKNGDIIIFRARDSYTARVDSFILYTDLNNGVRGTGTSIRRDVNLGTQSPSFMVYFASFYDNGSVKQFEFNVYDYNWNGSLVAGTHFAQDYIFECYVLRKVVGGQ